MLERDRPVIVITCFSRRIFIAEPRSSKIKRSPAQNMNACGIRGAG
jgi:hypothetical protein